MSFQANITEVNCDRCGKEMMMDVSSLHEQKIFCSNCQEILNSCKLSLSDLCDEEDVFGIMFLLGCDREEAEAEIRVYDRYYNPTISDMLIEHGSRG